MCAQIIINAVCEPMKNAECDSMCGSIRNAVCGAVCEPKESLYIGELKNSHQKTKNFCCRVEFD